MVYVLAALMGYVVATNSLIEKRVKSFPGMGYANPLMGKLSALGGLGGWFCILPAAYFVASAAGNGFLQGVLFCLAALGGALLGGLFQVHTLSYAISTFALFINVGLAVIVYKLSPKMSYVTLWG